MKKGLALFALVLVVAVISVVMYSSVEKNTQLSPEEGFYQKLYASNPRIAKERCDGGMEKFLMTIYECRVTQTESASLCAEQDGSEGCIQEMKGTFSDCISRAINKFCPELRA